MAAEVETCRSSGSSADSYIGSLISLTSKSEIRYEGVLFNINTDESSIGLKNVRSFGSEGRKKDGPQVPPSDKVYEYILFRGSDIKDLQVKSSPPAQPTPTVHKDLAVQQSHYSQPASLSTNVPSVGSVTAENHSSHLAQLPRSAVYSGLPLYQPGGSSGTWGSSAAYTCVNSSGFPMTMYGQGYYGSSSGIPQVQQSSIRAPPGMPIPPSMQQQMQNPGMNASTAAGSLNLSEVPPSLLQPVGTSSNQSLASAPLLSTMPPNQASALPSEMPSSLMSNKIPISSISLTIPIVNLPSTSLSTSNLETSAAVGPVLSNPLMVPTSVLPYQPKLQSLSVIGRAATSSQPETLIPSLVTPNQLLQPERSTDSTFQSFQVANRVDAIPQISTEPATSTSAPSVDKAGILPLPTVSDQKVSPSTTTFTEEFDFMAMNEKFKKDEVWGHLGSTKNQSMARGTMLDRYTNDVLSKEDTRTSSSVAKPVYVKDDFFDTLSCDSLDQSRNGRPRFSEQRKIDSETFGDFQRHHGRWGGRGPGRGGRGPGRGGYYRQGYGYAGRGRGYMM